MDKEAYKVLIHDIVKSEFPDELMSMEVSFSEKFDDLNQGKDITKQNSAVGASFESGAGIVEVLNFVTILAGTFNAILQVIEKIKKLKKSKDDVAENTWVEELVKAGLKEEKAKEIASKFKDDLLKQIG